MKPVHSTIRVLMFTLISLAYSPRSDATGPTEAEPDRLQLRQILQKEARTDVPSISRRSVLQPTLNSKVSNAAWWQSGYVKNGDAWHRAEKSPGNVTELYEEYLQRRADAPKTFAAQLELANWCQQHKLTTQERAHLSEAIFLSEGADCTPLFKRMGYRRIGDQWVSPVELAAQQFKAKQLDSKVREWQPKMQRIIRNWTANPKQHKQGQDELKAIQDPGAIPVLVAASSADESLAVAICECLDKITSYEASQALATMAVRSEWPSVRRVAAEHLKSRRIDDFAPALLSEMRSPFKSIKRDEKLSDTARLIFREEADRFYVIDLQVLPGGNWEVIDVVHPRRQTVDRYSNAPINPARFNNDRSRAIATVDNEVQKLVEEENDRADDYNQRCADLLAELTGQDPCSNPLFWWAWWHLHTGTQPPPKHCQVDHRKAGFPTTGYYRRVIGCSCLVAGTPILTDRGPIAVEKVLTGDRVLSKDISTGEIDYKPVVHTTERQPVPVTKFEVGGEAIVASSGHHFWVSGTGWTKTRELKTGQPIHTAVGMTRIEKIEQEPDPAPVYNLVVADFHTYFIGPAMVLSHDVAQPMPTNIKVPGLEE